MNRRRDRSRGRNRCRGVSNRPEAAGGFILATAAALLIAAGCTAEGGGFQGEDYPVWTVEPELRIGSPDDPEFVFSRVSALEVGPDGSIYSMHPQESQIHIWTPDGRPAGTIGRRGEGPGEFAQLRSFGWHADSLWVHDSGNTRISYFSPEGELRGSVTVGFDLGSPEQAQRGIYPARPNALFRDGSLHSVTPGFSQAIAEGTLTRVAHVRAGADGTTLDTLAIIAVGPATTLAILRDGGGTFTSQPFGDGSLTQPAVDGSGLFVLDRAVATDAGEADFRVTRLDLGGDTVYSRTYPYPPLPLPSTVVDSAVAASAERLHRFMGERTGTSLSQWRGWTRDAMYVPAFYPPIEETRAGRDGTIWLKRTLPGAEGAHWFVIAEDGEPLATAVLPEGLRLLAADRGQLWGVEQDEYDVDYIVRYQTVPPEG
jgi:hypothetical protein